MIPFCSGNVRLSVSPTIHSYVYMHPVRGCLMATFFPLMGNHYRGSYPCALCRGRLTHGNGARRVDNFGRTVSQVVKDLFYVRSKLHSVRNQFFQRMAISLCGPGRAGATKWRGCSNRQLEFIFYPSSSRAMGNKVPKQSHTALIMENMTYHTGNRFFVAENVFMGISQLFRAFEINIMNICHNEIKWRISLWTFQIN